MPGSVSNAAPSTVLPWSLCKAFGHSREYIIVENEYRNGETQREKLTATSRKRWTMTRRLIPSALDTLRDFFEARAAGHQPFYFYDPFETVPKFSYDPTGVETVGRYTVRFDGHWEQVADMRRGEVSLALVELA